ncbi:MAG: hypothetical protein PHX41_08780, partial [Kiritimatiellae bacterium]|nr:hypothetical protein [Kiritimatiellia bacterium]
VSTFLSLFPHPRPYRASAGYSGSRLEVLGYRFRISVWQQSWGMIGLKAAKGNRSPAEGSITSSVPITARQHTPLHFVGMLALPSGRFNPDRLGNPFAI